MLTPNQVEALETVETVLKRVSESAQYTELKQGNHQPESSLEDALHVVSYVLNHHVPSVPFPKPKPKNYAVLAVAIALFSLLFGSMIFETDIGFYQGTKSLEITIRLRDGY